MNWRRRPIFQPCRRNLKNLHYQKELQSIVSSCNLHGQLAIRASQAVWRDEVGWDDDCLSSYLKLCNLHLKITIINSENTRQILGSYSRCRKACNSNSDLGGVGNQFSILEALHNAPVKLNNTKGAVSNSLWIFTKREKRLVPNSPPRSFVPFGTRGASLLKGIISS